MTNHFLFFSIVMLMAIVVSSMTAYSVEGIISAPLGASSDWPSLTKVLLDGNRHSAFVQPHGHFLISHVVAGSYLLEVVHPSYLFHPLRIEITSKGKIRARKSIPMKPNTVITVPYPLRISSVGKMHYFQEREQLRTLDLFLNPTVLVLVAPLLLFMILPKLADTSDPEFQKEMQNFKLFNPKQTIPDFSEMLTSMGGAQKAITGKKIPKKKGLNTEH